MKKFTRKQAGISLIEVMIAGTVMTVALMGLAQMSLNQAKQQQSARAKADFLNLQAQIQNAVASPLAIRASAESVGISFRGFNFGLLDLANILKPGQIDPTLVAIDPSVFQNQPIIDPDLVYSTLRSTTPNVVDTFRPVSPLVNPNVAGNPNVVNPNVNRIPGGGFTDPSPVENNAALGR